MKHGMVQVAVCSPKVVVGNPTANAKEILSVLSLHKDAAVVVFPELATTGYTCADLFHQQALLEKSEAAIKSIITFIPSMVIVGAPIPVGNKLFNCAVVIANGTILGIVPKQFIPNYKEFYEGRWFSRANGSEPKEIYYAGKKVNFGIDLIFKNESGDFPLDVFVEICEDLWMPIPPSSYAAIAGANLLVNISGSNETVAKDEYRQELVRNQSGRCIAAYAYASAGPSESTTDLVFSGHCMIAENGTSICDTPHVGDGKINLESRSVATDIDLEKLAHDRRVQGTFGDSTFGNLKPFRTIPWKDYPGRPWNEYKLIRKINGTPFVPSNPNTLSARCAAIFDIQCSALAKRMRQINENQHHPLNIGVSGGLDSTHALLVCHKACEALGLPPTNIKAFTMPGFGTTEKTKGIAIKLMELLKVDARTIDIRPACMQTFRDLNHKPFGIHIGTPTTGTTVEYFQKFLQEIPKEERHDLVFENVQARERTKYLMNSGFVVGTGDMSELALGWCTYNADHMSMYNPNCSLPKTLIRFMIDYVAKNHYPAGPIRDTLLECAALTISPELLPTDKDGNIEQSTEDYLGSYILHDFFLFHFVRNGFGPKKILFLAEQAEFPKSFTKEQIVKALKIFIKRFFPAQFKRSCVPDGPKVGSVSLSPRGDWRMPSDADASIWLEEIK